MLQKKIDQYTTIEQINKGNYVLVFKVRDDNDLKHQFKAMKMIPKLINQIADDIKEEIEILKKCENKNILKYYEVRQTSNHIYIITEFCELGSLAEYIKNHENKKIPEKEALQFFQQILNAFYDLQNIRKKGNQISAIHRDIKPENILLDDNLMIKISDLGTSKVLEIMQSINKYPAYYMSPEFLQNQFYDSKADIWNLGLVLYEMLAGKKLFKNSEKTEADQINKKVWFESFLNKSYVDSKLQKISEECLKMLYKMLKINPQERIDWEELNMHPVFKEHKIIEMIDNEKSLNLRLSKFDSEQISTINMNKLNDKLDESSICLYHNLNQLLKGNSLKKDTLEQSTKSTLKNISKSNSEPKVPENRRENKNFSSNIESNVKNFNQDLSESEDLESKSINSDSFIGRKNIESITKKKIISKNDTNGILINKNEYEDKMEKVNKIYFFIRNLFVRMAEMLEKGLKLSSNFPYNYGFIVFLKKFELLLESLKEEKKFV